MKFSFDSGGEIMNLETPIFQWNELNNKILSIKVNKEDGYICVIGSDISTGIHYLLHCDKDE